MKIGRIRPITQHSFSKKRVKCRRDDSGGGASSPVDAAGSGPAMEDRHKLDLGAETRLEALPDVSRLGLTLKIDPN